MLDRTPGPDGTVLTAKLRLGTAELMLFDGGPHHSLSPAFSLFLSVREHTELDRYWAALSDGGEPGPCGWLVDRFGLSWQVVPTVLGRLLSDPDRDRSERVRQAMLGMSKIEIAALQAAYDG